MYTNDKILVGKSEDKELNILLNMANRHGLITGASGSGKTVTLKVMAESFSDAGVPVFLNVKSSQSASGICMVKTVIQSAPLSQTLAPTFYR